ncbi:hypothetical protein IID19_02145 [Patescibacteria group bacterium]|nr:hypothetical protein [Patescibacteria group bacterium]
MKVIKNLFFLSFLATGLSLVSYVALAQVNISDFEVPTFEVAPTAGPVLSGSGVTMSAGNVVQDDNLRITTEATDVSGIETVLAVIKDGSGSTIVTITLYDDGVHGDGSPGDSIFSNTWNVGSTADGIYSIDIQMTDRLDNSSTVTNAISLNVGPALCTADSECLTSGDGDVCCVSTGLCAFSGCAVNSDCDDFDGSTIDTCNTATCPSVCQNTLITTCTDNDNYCPSGCVIANDNDCSDITPPTVSFKFPPSDGFPIDTINYDVVVYATDTDSGISKVEFYVDSEASPRDTQLFDSPAGSGDYISILDASSLTNGLHTLKVIAYDNVALQFIITRTVDINIISAAPFNVQITAPTDGSSYARSDTIQFAVHAEDDVAVTQLSLYSVTGGLFWTLATNGPSITVQAGIAARSISRIPEAIIKYVDVPSGFRSPFISIARAAEECTTSSTTVFRDVYASAVDGDSQATLSGTIQIAIVTTTTSCININSGGGA